MTPLSALATLAARQHQVISTAQLRSLGWSKDGIRHLVADERISRIHRAVYRASPYALTREGRWMAAVLACSPSAALSHQSAAVLWDLLRHDPAHPHVIGPFSASGRGPAAVVVHRSRTLEAADVGHREGIPVTTAVRTLCDCAAAGLHDTPLKAAVRQASRVHHIDLTALARQPRLRDIVRLYDPLTNLTESDFEVIFLAMCVKYALPLPAPQVGFGRRRADFTWPEYHLIVECDSRQWHDNDVNFLEDRRKDRALKEAGYEVLRFTWAEVGHSPAPTSFVVPSHGASASCVCALWGDRPASCTRGAPERRRPR